MKKYGMWRPMVSSAQRNDISHRMNYEYPNDIYFIKIMCPSIIHRFKLSSFMNSLPFGGYIEQKKIQ